MPEQNFQDFFFRCSKRNKFSAAAQQLAIFQKRVSQSNDLRRCEVQHLSSTVIYKEVTTKSITNRQNHEGAACLACGYISTSRSNLLFRRKYIFVFSYSLTVQSHLQARLADFLDLNMCIKIKNVLNCFGLRRMIAYWCCSEKKMQMIFCERIRPARIILVMFCWHRLAIFCVNTAKE